ncbi:hypothetical protein GCM10009540_84600 [Streptomyces turgidiscabies]
MLLKASVFNGKWRESGRHGVLVHGSSAVPQASRGDARSRSPSAGIAAPDGPDPPLFQDETSAFPQLRWHGRATVTQRSRATAATPIAVAAASGAALA